MTHPVARPATRRLKTLRVPPEIDDFIAQRADDQDLSWAEVAVRMLRYAQQAAGTKVRINHTEEWTV